MTYQRRKGHARGKRPRRYYDPGTAPQPRKPAAPLVDDYGSRIDRTPAPPAVETRQQRRARERRERGA